MIVATRPDPTVPPPSRSDLVVFRSLFITVFAVLRLILWVFYLLFLLFPGEMLQIRITLVIHIRDTYFEKTEQDFRKFRSVHLDITITRELMNVN